MSRTQGIGVESENAAYDGSGGVGGLVEVKCGGWTREVSFKRARKHPPNVR